MPKQPAKVNKKKVSFKNEVTYLFILLGVIILLFLSTYNLNLYLKRQKVLGSATVTSSSLSEIAFWEDFLNENGNYIEGWFELAELKMGEGNITGAREALIKVEKINPNSERLMKLKKSL